MTSYAFRGSTGDVVAMYPDLAPPVPLHALRASSVAAVAAVRAAGVARRLDAQMAALVTSVGRPARVPYDGEVVTAGARTLRAVAEAAGFSVRITTTHDACTVEGLRDRVGFRATWRRGATAGGSWHEPWRYAMIDDDRPVGIDSRSKTGKVGHRSPGVGTRRLALVASPWGVPVNVTELTRRIREVSST